MAENKLPRWRGFNLTGMVSRRRFELAQAEDRPVFPEDDFRWMAEWGFNFARIPMDYRCWVPGTDPFAIDEAVFEHVDRLIQFGDRYDLHISLNFHTAPGYCINPRPLLMENLWQNARTLEAFCLHWRYVAMRYEGTPPERLSFDLVNEPPSVADDVMTVDDYVRVTRAATETIHGIDPQRLVIADGYNIGRTPCPELAGTPNLAQSTRGYDPHSISHYGAPWADGLGFPTPTWPEEARGRITEPWNRARLEQHYAPWAALMEQGVGVHCGECGCYVYTPHAVFLAWFGDLLDILDAHGIGYALWNLRGQFGILDSQRYDVAYEDWHGHKLDRALLDLLQAH